MASAKLLFRDQVIDRGTRRAVHAKAKSSLLTTLKARVLSLDLCDVWSSWLLGIFRFSLSVNLDGLLGGCFVGPLPSIE